MSYSILIFSDYDHLVGSKLTPAFEPPKEWNFLQCTGKKCYTKRKCGISSSCIPHPHILLTSIFDGISKFSKIFIHNPNYWKPPCVLNILNYNYMRFDGHSFVFLKALSILMMPGRNPHPPTIFRVKMLPAY